MTKKFPTVSVIIPSYNRAHLLARAIQSVLDQTYQDFELILVDDGSTDNTEEVVKGFNDDRIRYIRHDENRGGAAARNTGIKAAIGDYVAFLDSDDEWLPERIKKGIQKFQELNNAIDIVYSNIIVDNGKARKKYLSNGVSGNIKKFLIVNNYVHVNTATVKKECFSDILFDEMLPKHQDWDLWIRMSKRYLFAYIDQPLSIWHTDTERPRINTNIQNIIDAHTIFIHKHHEELAKHRKFFSSMLYSIGHIYNKLGDLQNGRKYLIESLRVYSIKYAILSLPDSTKAYRLNVQVPKIGELKKLIPRPILKPPLHEFNGEHYWEIGKAGYPLSRIMGDIGRVGFNVTKSYRVFEMPYHRFFILVKGGQL